MSDLKDEHRNAIWASVWPDGLVDYMLKERVRGRKNSFGAREVRWVVARSTPTFALHDGDSEQRFNTLDMLSKNWLYLLFKDEILRMYAYTKMLQNPQGIYALIVGRVDRLTRVSVLNCLIQTRVWVRLEEYVLVQKVEDRVFKYWYCFKQTNYVEEMKKYISDNRTPYFIVHQDRLASTKEVDGTSEVFLRKATRHLAPVPPKMDISQTRYNKALLIRPDWSEEFQDFMLRIKCLAYQREVELRADNFADFVRLMIIFYLAEDKLVFSWGLGEAERSYNIRTLFACFLGAYPDRAWLEKFPVGRGIKIRTPAGKQVLFGNGKEKSTLGEFLSQEITLQDGDRAEWKEISVILDDIERMRLIKLRSIQLL